MKCVFLCNFHLVDHKLLTTFMICSKSICLALPIIFESLWALERLKNKKCMRKGSTLTRKPILVKETNFPPCWMTLKPTFWVELGEWEELQNSFHHHCSFEHEAPHPITLLRKQVFMLNLEKENNYDISSTIIAPLSLDFVSHNFIEKQKENGLRNNLLPSLQLATCCMTSFYGNNC
jgi:hypothetical protein